MSDNTNYQTLREWDLPDFHGTGTLYRHNKSGAQVFHLANDDRENFFAFAFATLPEDSTGVAHILEHTVLCGSRRFPVKDPFLQLLKGSVNTFLNAMTYPDKTVYPAASPVRQDLFNMMSVYGDAVFRPLLKPEMFRQEGHRLQFDSEGTLEITGVVYNEMKGNYSSHDSIAGEKCFQSLFPDTLYRHDSGGDPAVIPELTWEQFIAFHRRYYHPSNARIILYGDIPAGEYLEFLDHEFLRDFDGSTTYTVQEEQPRWDAPRVFETTYPVDTAEDLEGRSSVTLNWMLFPVTETRRLLAASVLAEVLVGHSGSPLAKALIDSGLGQDLSPVFGMEADLREAVFSAGLRGTEPHRAAQIETLVLDTLKDLVKRGLNPAIVEGALRRVEFRHRELKSGPNGIRVMNRVLRTWMYGGSPAAALQFSEDLAAIRERLQQEPRFFEQMIQELLVENTHRSTVIVRPDPEQSQRQESQLREVLQSRAASLSPQQRDELVSDAQHLEAIQVTPDDPDSLAAIPFLQPEDIPRGIHHIDYSEAPLPQGGTLYRHQEGTNGVLYLDCTFDFGMLTSRQEALLNLLGGAFTEMGLPGLSFDAFNHEVRLKTGGLSVFVSNNTHMQDLSRVRRLLVVRLKVLSRAWRDGAEILQRLLRGVDFSDATRLRQIVEEMVQEMIGAVIPSGHYFAGLRSGTDLNGLARLEEEMNGITQLEHLRGFLQEDMSRLGRELSQLTSGMLDPARLNVNVTGDSAALEDLVTWLPELVSSLQERRASGDFSPVNGLDGEGAGAPATPGGSLPGVIVPPGRADGTVPEYLLASAGVAYVAATIPGYAFNEPLASAQDVLAHILRTGLLWEKIRMQGGAYGAFAQSRTAEGLFSFASYRDPHSARTLDAYREALRELSRDPLPQAALDLAKVSMLGRELRPLTPRDAGFVNFRRRLHGIDDELRQEVRDGIRRVDVESIREVATTLADRFSEARVVILGGRSGLEELHKLVPETRRDGGVRVLELGV